jgi:hypothetical protein
VSAIQESKYLLEEFVGCVENIGLHDFIQNEYLDLIDVYQDACMFLKRQPVNIGHFHNEDEDLN